MSKVAKKTANLVHNKLMIINIQVKWYLVNLSKKVIHFTFKLKTSS